MYAHLSIENTQSKLLSALWLQSFAYKHHLQWSNQVSKQSTATTTKKSLGKQLPFVWLYFKYREYFGWYVYSFLNELLLLQQRVLYLLTFFPASSTSSSLDSGLSVFIVHNAFCFYYLFTLVLKCRWSKWGPIRCYFLTFP